jgi:hypothetical protein
LPFDTYGLQELLLILKREFLEMSKHMNVLKNTNM